MYKEGEGGGVTVIQMAVRQSSRLLSVCQSKIGMAEAHSEVWHTGLHAAPEAMC